MLYEVVFGFDGQEPSELSVTKGLVVVGEDDDVRDGWILVTAGDRRGYVPESHLAARPASPEQLLSQHEESFKRVQAAAARLDARLADLDEALAADIQAAAHDAAAVVARLEAVHSALS